MITDEMVDRVSKKLWKFYQRTSHVPESDAREILDEVAALTLPSAGEAVAWKDPNSDDVASEAELAALPADRQDRCRSIYTVPLYLHPSPSASEAQKRSDIIERLSNSLAIFTKHYESWMDRWGDDEQSSTFSRHTFGQLREARKLIEKADALTPEQGETAPSPETHAGGWNYDMSAAPKDRRILGLCRHDADQYHDASTGRLTDYGCWAEAVGRVEDGPHVLEWGGEDSDYDEWSGRTLTWPNWWFRFGSEFETVANPIAWMPIPADHPSPQSRATPPSPSPSSTEGADNG